MTTPRLLSKKELAEALRQEAMAAKQHGVRYDGIVILLYGLLHGVQKSLHRQVPEMLMAGAYHDGEELARLELRDEAQALAVIFRRAASFALHVDAEIAVVTQGEHEHPLFFERRQDVVTGRGMAAATAFMRQVRLATTPEGDKSFPRTITIELPPITGA